MGGYSICLFPFAFLSFSQFASGVFNIQSHQPTSTGTTQCRSLNSGCWHTPLSNIPGRREVRCLTRSKDFIGFQDSRIRRFHKRKKRWCSGLFICAKLKGENLSPTTTKVQRKPKSIVLQKKYLGAWSLAATADVPSNQPSNE